MASPKGPLHVGTFLVGANLSAYTDKITSLGAAEVADLKDIEDAELSGLGMTTIEIRRLRRQATNTLSIWTNPDALPAGQQNEGLTVPAVPVNVSNTDRGSKVFNSAAPQPMTMHQPQQQPQQMMMQRPMMQQPMMQQPMLQQPMLQQPMMGQPMMVQPMMAPGVVVSVSSPSAPPSPNSHKPHTECTCAHSKFAAVASLQAHRQITQC